MLDMESPMPQRREETLTEEEKAKVRKFPPEVGARLTLSEWLTWCHGKAYCFVQGNAYAVMFCPVTTGEVRACFFHLIRGEKGEIKEVEKLDTYEFWRSEISQFLGGLSRLHEATKAWVDEERRKLELKEESDS